MAFCASGYLGRAREGTGYEPAPDQLGWACPIYVAETDARAREEARNNIYVFGIRGEGKSATHRAAALMAQKRFDAKMIHTHWPKCRPPSNTPANVLTARSRSL